MSQNVGQSRGSTKHKQFIQDSADSFIVESFRDVSIAAPGSPADGEGYVVSDVSSIDGSWGIIVGLADNDIIRYRVSKLQWQIVHKAAVANQGSKVYIKDEDTLYAMDAGAEWAVASGSGGGVKNFALKQANGYKVGDWITGNNATFGTAGVMAGTFDIETVAPLDGKKSFKFTAAAGSENDWFYILVDIDKYARGGAIAYTFDYTWDGPADIKVKAYTADLVTELSTELNVVKNTTNDNKASRNSRLIFAQLDTEDQVIVGFQLPSGLVGGEEFIFDNLAVTDDIGVIGSGSVVAEVIHAEGYLLSNSSGSENPINRWGEQTNLGGAFDFSTGIFTVPSDGSYTVLTVAQSGGTDLRWALRHNGDLIKWARSRSSSGTCTIAATIPAVAGDTIHFSVSSSNTLGGGSPYQNYFSIFKEDTIDYSPRFLQVPNGEKLENTFSGTITNNWGTNPRSATTQGPVDWIDNILRTGTGDYVVNFKPGFFSVPPVCIAEVNTNGTTNGTFANVINITTTKADIHVRTHANAPLDEQVSITAHRQGSDTAPNIIGVPVSIQGQTHEADTSIEIQNFGGYASLFGDVNIHTFTNIQISRGSAVSLESNAGFRINESGLYHISSNSAQVSDNNWQIYKNSPALANMLAAASATTATTGKSCSATRYLVAGDIVYVRGGNTIASSNDGIWNFTIAKVGTQPLLDGGLVEQPGFSMMVHRAAESANTHVLTWLNVLSGSDNDWFKFVNDAANGDYYEILEDGIYHANASFGDNQSAAQEWGITVNAPAVTFSSINANYPETVIAMNRTPAQANATGSCSGSRRLYKGDKVRVQYQGSLSVGAAPQEMYFGLAKVGQTVKYSSRVYKEDPIAWQRKELTVAVTSTAAVINQLTFNNLDIGQTYEVEANVLWNFYDGNIFFGMDNGANSINIGNHREDANSGSLVVNGTHRTFKFIAVDPTITFYYTELSGGSSQLNPGTTITLTELPFHAQTSKWS